MIIFKKFTKWFELNLGWFFVNGMKQDKWNEYLKNKELDREYTVCKIGLEHHPDDITGQFILAQTYLLKNNISETTFDIVMKNSKFLPNVIKYDRFQPEFYEDTITYITKRSSIKKVKNG